MIYAPIIIPTLNRFEHFKNCLESLSKCTHAEFTEVFIGLDYPPSEKYFEGYNLIKDYLTKIGNLRFKKINVYKREKNYGPGPNFKDLKRIVFEKYDRVIATEDDNVFSPCFLDYMNKSLEKYFDDPTIASVCGFNKQQHYVHSHTTYLSRVSSAWGIGLWKHKEVKIQTSLSDKEILKCEIFNWRRAIYYYLHNPFTLIIASSMLRKDHLLGDVCRTIINHKNGWYQLRPCISLVRNMGYDGSGVHGGNVIFANLPINESLEFFDDKLLPSTSYISKRIEYVDGFSLKLFNRIIQILFLVPFLYICNKSSYNNR